MNILIADDSAVFRVGIAEGLEGCEGISKIKSVANGKLAVEYLLKNKDVDILILDLEMPVMNGMETLDEIKKQKIDVSIILCSSLTQRGAKLTITGLLKGADDFVPKGTAGKTAKENLEAIKEEMYPKMVALYEKRRGESLLKKSKPKKVVPAEEVKPVTKALAPISDIYRDGIPTPDLILIGSSTGGPDALNLIFSKVNHMATIPILLIQHMPRMFTRHLVDRLNRAGAIEFKEAEDGEFLEKGKCYVAPGDFHMLLRKRTLPDGKPQGKDEYFIRLNQAEKVQNVRPSVDVTFKSAAENFSGKILTIVLTGMGNDGEEGAILLNEKGNDLFYVQDEESCTTWGMPSSLIGAGIGAKMLRLDQFSILIDEIMKKRAR